ncbi:hypothetical protein J4430_03215 [Candidatus Woesearchaeota archaeon]|nr:hypothetical protein [Candidatus Woesearchaeota archaeon]
MARLQYIDEVPLFSIQSGEDFICQESVEYFLKNPNIRSLVFLHQAKFSLWHFLQKLSLLGFLSPRKSSPFC